MARRLPGGDLFACPATCTAILQGMLTLGSLLPAGLPARRTAVSASPWQDGNQAQADTAAQLAGKVQLGHNTPGDPTSLKTAPVSAKKVPRGATPAASGLLAAHTSSGSSSSKTPHCLLGSGQHPAYATTGVKHRALETLWVLLAPEASAREPNKNRTSAGAAAQPVF